MATPKAAAKKTTKTTRKTQATKFSKETYIKWYNESFEN